LQRIECDLELVGWDRRSYPRVKAPLSGGPIKPKAEALGYLEATAKTTTTTKANAGILRFAQNDGLLEVASDLRVADDGFER
jgi:hypothetical protein